MARIEVETLVVVRRVVVETDGRSVLAPIGATPGRLGGKSLGWTLPVRPSPGRLAVTASSLVAIAGVVLGGVARRRSSGSALPWTPPVKALPASARRHVPSLPAGLGDPEG